MNSRTKAGEIPSSHYKKEYYFSHEYYNSAGAYKQFTKGGKPADIYLQALSNLAQTNTGTYLDIGCGKGELVIYHARLGGNAVGIDYSDAAIEICRNTLKNESTAVKRRAQFQVADTTKLPFKDEAFDVVFFLDVIEHLTKAQTEKALHEIKRVLKKGGKVIVHTNNKYFERGTKLCIALSYHGLNGILHPKKLLATSSHPYEYMHINYVTPTWLASYMKALGFQTATEYPKPKQKSEIHKYITYNEKWKRILYTNIGWILFNSPLIIFFAPTFWLIGTKKT
jgi:ubiquinone/menaquinone biosynthesis C-methylase UbiE